MGRALDQLSISGFKSINELARFPLRKLNVLIGANGAGKSNFVDFFRMLRAMSEEGLAAFVLGNGKADAFLHNGPGVTRQIKAHLVFGQNEFQFELEPTASNELMVKSEQVLWRGGGGWRSWGGGQLESKLKSWKGRRSEWGSAHSVESYVYDAVSSWVVYHFHDTSKNAPMRRDQALRDWAELRPDAGNLAAFLHRLGQTHPAHYGRIRQTIQLVAPFFDEFLLEPDGELIRLQWRQRGSSRPLQPHQFSDGTIRFIGLVTALLQPNPPATVLIDEPELGLHPFALDMLAQLVKECADGTQVILSTQSPPLLNHFEPEDVVVVDRAENGSRFRRLESEPLAGWLREYTLGELVQKNVVEAGPSHA